MAAYVATLFGVGLLRRKRTQFLVRPLEAGEAQLNRYILLPLILLRHIHHLAQIIIS
jgi:hypothetical protein